MTTQDSITVQDFQELLKTHDWYYEYSDDHSAWKRGKESAARIAVIAQSSAKMEAVYTQFRAGE